MAKLTIFGSGVMVPTKKRYPSSLLLQTDKTNLLLDCGPGANSRLTEMGFDFNDLDGIFISHFHTDHFADAFPLVHARKVNDLYHKRDHKKLVFIGPSPIGEHYKTWRTIFWPEPKEDYPLEFMEGVGKWKIGNIKLETFPVNHVPWFNSVGARIEVDGKTIVYPGDVGSNQDPDQLANEVYGADLLIIESGNPNPSPNHYSIDQIEDLAERINFRLAEDKMVVNL